MDTTIVINGKKCDLLEAFPIKMGVYKKLLRNDIDPAKGNLSTLDSITLSEILVASANKEITEEDLDEMGSDQMAKMSEIINFLNDKESKKSTVPLVDG